MFLSPRRVHTEIVALHPVHHWAFGSSAWGNDAKQFLQHSTPHTRQCNFFVIMPKAASHSGQLETSFSTCQRFASHYKHNQKPKKEVSVAADIDIEVVKILLPHLRLQALDPSQSRSQ